MKIISILFILIISLEANEKLNELFEALKNVKQVERFKVVNEIKQQIIQLNKQERLSALKMLKAKKEQEKKLVKQVLPKDVSKDMTVDNLEHEHVSLSNHSEHSLEHMEKMPMDMSHMQHNMALMKDVKRHEAMMSNMPNTMPRNR